MLFTFFFINNTMSILNSLGFFNVFFFIYHLNYQGIFLPCSLRVYFSFNFKLYRFYLLFCNFIHLSNKNAVYFYFFFCESEFFLHFIYLYYLCTFFHSLFIYFKHVLMLSFYNFF